MNPAVAGANPVGHPTTLDAAWAAAEAAMPPKWTLALETNMRGTYVARALPPFLPYEEWFEAIREEFGDSPVEALHNLSVALWMDQHE